MELEGFELEFERALLNEKHHVRMDDIERLMYFPGKGEVAEITNMGYDEWSEGFNYWIKLKGSNKCFVYTEPLNDR